MGVYLVFRHINVNCISFRSNAAIYLTRDANYAHRRRALLSAFVAVRNLELILGLFEHIHFTLRHDHHYELLALKVCVANSLDKVVDLAPRSSGNMGHLGALLPSVGCPKTNSVVNRSRHHLISIGHVQRYDIAQVRARHGLGVNGLNSI